MHFRQIMYNIGIVKLLGQGQTSSCLCFPPVTTTKVRIRTKGTSKNPYQNLPEWGIIQVWNFAHRLNLMEDNLLRKTTFYERLPCMKDSHQWITTFNGRQPIMENPFNGR